MAQSVWTGGSHHTGLAALPHENIHQALKIIIFEIGDHEIQCIDLDLKLKKDPCQ